MRGAESGCTRDDVGGRSGEPARSRPRADARRVAAGWRAILPGLPQWHAGQRARGAVLAASYAGGLGVGAFAWGTLPGYGLIGFALGTHLISAADALRRAPVATLGGRRDRAILLWWLLTGLYAPILAVAIVSAWPGVVLHLDRPSYLVNLWAYRGREPGHGDLVLYRHSRQAEPRLGRVVGGPSQSVAWSSGRLRVDGVQSHERPPALPGSGLRALTFVVPEGFFLVRPEPALPGRAHGLFLVDRREILGRVWAQYYPVRERRLLK